MRALIVLMAACSSGAGLSSGDADVTASALAQVSPSAIRAIEDHRLSADPTLLRALGSSDATVLKPALLAAGRIRDPGYLPAMLPSLSHADPSVREQAIYALELSANPEAATALAAKLSDASLSAAELGASLHALGTLGDADAFARAEDVIATDTRAEARAGAFWAYANLVRKRDVSLPLRPDALAVLLTEAPADPHASRALSSAVVRYKNTTLPWADVAAALARAENTRAASYLMSVAAVYPSEQSTPLLRSILVDPTAASPRRDAALTALDTAGVAQTADYQVALTAASPASRVVGSQLLANKPSAIDATLRGQLVTMAKTDPSAWVRSAALSGAYGDAPATGATALQEALASPFAPLHEAAMSLISDEQTLMQYALSEDPTLYVYALIGLANAPLDQLPEADARTLVSELLKAARDDVTGLKLWAAGQVAVGKGLTDFGPALVSLYPAFAPGSGAQTFTAYGRAVIMGALAGLHDQDALPTVQAALSDGERDVVAAAIAAYTTITGNAPQTAVPINSVVVASTPSDTDIEHALQTRVRLSLARGDIVVHMLDVAPVTAAKFVSMVEDSVYDGLIFYRVEPGFVAQVGDATGFALSGSYVRDELSTYGHHRGTLAMASSGRDEATNQFFFNLVDNFHLDVAYTVFAEIESGLDLIDAIEAGEPLLQARVLQRQ